MRIVQIWGSEHCSGEELLFPHLFTDIHKGMTKKHKKHGLIFLFEIFYMCSCWEKAVKNKSKTGHQPEGQMSPQSSWSSSSPSPPRCWSASLAVALQLESWSSYLKTATISSLLWDRTPPSPPQVLREYSSTNLSNMVKVHVGHHSIRFGQLEEVLDSGPLFNSNITQPLGSGTWHWPPHLPRPHTSRPRAAACPLWAHLAAGDDDPWRCWKPASHCVPQQSLTFKDLGDKKIHLFLEWHSWQFREPNKGDTSGIASHLIDIIWNNGS